MREHWEKWEYLLLGAVLGFVLTTSGWISYNMVQTENRYKYATCVLEKQGSQPICAALYGDWS